MHPSPQHQPKVSLDGLDLDHYHPLVRAINNVLSTDLAEFTFAQLIDGLPVVDTVWDMRGSLLIKGHPLFNHDRLCEGAREQARMLRNAFDPALLGFDSQALQHYQNAALETREFNMRLIELLAAAIHQVAVLLFESEDKLHSKQETEAVVSWRKESQWVELEGGRKIFDEYLEPHPTLFYHVDYMDQDQYPHGLADVAGYWAEDRILGGVALFDRGDSGSEARDVYFHSGRQKATFRVWRLLDSQFSDIITFLLADSPSESPFPILPSQHNRHRHDPWDAMVLHHIFRDPWERKVPSTKPEETRDVRSVHDYPELEDMFEQLNAAAQEYDWAASMEQQAMPWMPERHDGYGAEETRFQTVGGEIEAAHDDMASSGDDANSLRVVSPPRTPPPASPVLSDMDDVQELRPEGRVEDSHEHDCPHVRRCHENGSPATGQENIQG